MLYASEAAFAILAARCNIYVACFEQRANFDGRTSLLTALARSLLTSAWAAPQAIVAPSLFTLSVKCLYMRCAARSHPQSWLLVALAATLEAVGSGLEAAEGPGGKTVAMRAKVPMVGISWTYPPRLLLVSDGRGGRSAWMQTLTFGTKF